MDKTWRMLGGNRPTYNHGPDTLNRTIFRLEGEGGVSNFFDTLPDECPKCHKGQTPGLLAGWGPESAAMPSLALRCTDIECGIIFLAYYRAVELGSDFSNHHHKKLGGVDRVFCYTTSTPRTYLTTDWGDEMRDLSLGFCASYNEAEHAHGLGLELVAGPGYRKALEFLLKDFCISNLEKDPDEIASKPLGKLIREDVGNNDLRVAATSAAWLGNDETHYQRMNHDYDIDDLVEAVKLAAYWVKAKLKGKTLETKLLSK